MHRCTSPWGHFIFLSNVTADDRGLAPVYILDIISTQTSRVNIFTILFPGVFNLKIKFYSPESNFYTITKSLYVDLFFFMLLLVAFSIAIPLNSMCLAYSDNMRSSHSYSHTVRVTVCFWDPQVSTVSPIAYSSVCLTYWCRTNSCHCSKGGNVISILISFVIVCPGECV